MSFIDYLVAYPYLNKTQMIDACTEAYQAGHKLWIDSGAFTTYKAKKEPTPVDEFVRFVRTFPFQPERVFTLDVIGDPVRTNYNHKRIIDSGLNVVPIITPGTAVSDIDAMYGHSDLVAVGGIVTHKGAGGGIPWAKHVLVNNNRPVHLLGCLSKPLIAKYKPYSVDAASWEYGGLMGQVSLYMGRGRSVTIHRTDMGKRINEDQSVALESYGYNISDVRKESWWRGQNGYHRVIGAQSMIRFAFDCRLQFGTRVVLSLVNSNALSIVQKAFNIERGLVA
jgi:hypothetical protein